MHSAESGSIPDVKLLFSSGSILFPDWCVAAHTECCQPRKLTWAWCVHIGASFHRCDWLPVWDDLVSEFEWISCGLGSHREEQRHFRHLETFQGFRNYFCELETKARPPFGKDQILYCISCYENSSNIVSKCLPRFPYLGSNCVSLDSHILETTIAVLVI